ncbi:MAG: sterol desaturase family protein [Deltaproteobacteria bacterium]|nr:sterol desaturase family protein [Deltaproteobacteria bacterium]
MEHGLNLIALAIPFFLLFIGLELTIAWKRKQKIYRIADALADLGCGVGQRVALVFFGYLLGAVYVFVYDGFRIFTLEGWKAWVVAILIVDFIYYWWHRASHRVNLMWAVHAVHHQSEDYNLAVALRQTIFSPVTSLPFELPMALIGVPPLVWGAAASINTLYQFWIHTELIGKLPRPVELVMNTPSHHRVHHAINAQYLDRNYAGMFIVFDRWFGTFVEEQLPCTYGTVKRLDSFNAVFAQFAEFGVVWAKARGASVWDKLRIWFMPPEWLPSGPKQFPPLPERKHESPCPPALQRYAMAQFVGIVGVGSLIILYDWMDNAVLAGPGALVFAALFTVGLMLDGRRLGVPLEFLRLAVTAAAAFVWVQPRYGMAAAVGAVGVALAAAVWLRMATRQTPASTEAIAA